MPNAYDDEKLRQKLIDMKQLLVQDNQDTMANGRMSTPAIARLLDYQSLVIGYIQVNS